MLLVYLSVLLVFVSSLYYLYFLSKKPKETNKGKKMEEKNEEKLQEKKKAVAQLNAVQGKNYAAGVLPVCIGSEDGEPYILLVTPKSLISNYLS